MRSLAWLSVIPLALASCSSAPEPQLSTDGSPSAPVGSDPVDVPFDGVTKTQVGAFVKGDDLFGVPFRPSDGLGPLYIRFSCGSCHAEATRGPGLVEKMAVVESDGITTAADQSKLPFGHTIRPFVAADGKTPIVAPNDPSVKVTTRVGPPVLGRGYMEAVLDSEIERLAAEQATRADAIHGRINRVTYASERADDVTLGGFAKDEPNLIGRFGLKSRIATLTDFTADAFQGDMGITSPLRPLELANPDQLVDDVKTGIDTDAKTVESIANYMRMIAIPKRMSPSERGVQLFAESLCSACHAPSLKTRDDYPLAQLAGIDAPVFTDFLLHDMGAALADGMVDGQAGSRDWRTAPLIGLRFNRTYLHDGRASSIEDAVLQHDGAGSEAAGAVDHFKNLSVADRQTLVDYVGAL
jgi:CxxC motif-containing protein (DUF1111 family)